MASAVSRTSVIFAIGDMEMSVSVLFLVASFTAYVDGCPRLSVAVMAPPVLTCPDALIAAGLLVRDMALRPLLRRDGVTFTDRPCRLPWVEAAIFSTILSILARRCSGRSRPRCAPIAWTSSQR